jgi:hypothetical protein
MDVKRSLRRAHTDDRRGYASPRTPVPLSSLSMPASGPRSGDRRQRAADAIMTYKVR